MKTSFNILIAACFVSCIGQPGQSGGQSLFAEQPKTVYAYASEMNNMEMLRMTQMPGWQLLAGTQWTGNNYTNSIKGVNENMNANFFLDGGRSYMQSSLVQSGTSDGTTIYLNVMSAADYLGYVFRRQFPNVKNARRTMLKTLDMYPETERQQLEEFRVSAYNSMLQIIRESPGGVYEHLLGQTVDCSTAEYKWVQDGDTIVHSMQVVLSASYIDTRGPYLNTSWVSWSQVLLGTYTMPVRHRQKAEKDIEQINLSVKWNEQYLTALNQIVLANVQRDYAAVRRIQGEMAQSAIRHQQNMSRIIQETNDYVSNARREVYANRQASQERINQGWRGAVVGVDRYMGVDGKVMEVPVSMGNKVWQSAEGGTIYTSDSYLFQPVDHLYDKNGRLQEFRQLQLLK